jgi:hypothetical protein
MKKILFIILVPLIIWWINFCFLSRIYYNANYLLAYYEEQTKKIHPIFILPYQYSSILTCARESEFDNSVFPAKGGSDYEIVQYYCPSH